MGGGADFDDGLPFAMRMPRAFIHASKSSALIRWPFWLISKRFCFAMVAGVGSTAGVRWALGGRVAQAESARTPQSAAMGVVERIIEHRSGRTDGSPGRSVDARAAKQVASGAISLTKPAIRCGFVLRG